VTAQDDTRFYLEALAYFHYTREEVERDVRALSVVLQHAQMLKWRAQHAAE
jgi:hypothetical protein